MPTALPAPVAPPSRVLLGPGPSPVEPAVLAALARPTTGHLDPYFLRVMDEVRGMLRELFGTRAQIAFPISGTGSAGMETCLVNLIEPGDAVLVGVAGVFGQRMAEVARRAGARVETVEATWGSAVEPDALRAAARGKKFKVLSIVHAETSTGVLQPVESLRAVADELGALLVLDTVTSLGGLRVALDAWGVDAAYSGTQKCLSCPPGLSPVCLSERARETVANRRVPVQSWYLDLSLIGSYWGAERAYHHTAPINMIYGLHEALRLALAEGMEAREERHRLHARALAAGLEAMGLSLRVSEALRLPPLTAVAVPDGVDDVAARRHLLERFALEIGGGLGPMKGNTWRIGLMGAGSNRRNVTLCLSALASALRAQGHRPANDPLEACDAIYAPAESVSAPAAQRR